MARGKLYTKKELEQIVTLFEAGERISDIGAFLKRPPESIRATIHQLRQSGALPPKPTKKQNIESLKK